MTCVVHYSNCLVVVMQDIALYGVVVQPTVVTGQQCYYKDHHNQLVRARRVHVLNHLHHTVI
jgi:hypothetical protein